MMYLPVEPTSPPTPVTAPAAPDFKRQNELERVAASDVMYDAVYLCPSIARRSAGPTVVANTPFSRRDRFTAVKVRRVYT